MSTKMLFFSDIARGLKDKLTAWGRVHSSRSQKGVKNSYISVETGHDPGERGGAVPYSGQNAARSKGKVL